MDTKLIEESYGFRIKDIHNIKNISRIETDCGVKCLKRAHMSPSFFLFIYSAVNHLKRKGYEGVIPYSTTIDGSICIPDDKYVYYVVDWIEARECRFKRDEELKKAIKAAAELHRLSAGYVPPKGAKPRVFYNKWVEKCDKKSMELLEFSKVIEEKEYIDDFDEMFSRHMSYFWQQARESTGMINESPYWEVSGKSKEAGEFCHHDLANHNFLMTDNGNVYLIDFDYCIMDTRLHDISSLIIRNMRYGVWDIEKAYTILDEYNRVYPIDQKELKVIKAFMTFPQDFWQVGLQYYVEKQPWTMEYFLMRLGRIVNDREIRDKFLKEFLKL
ncbi:MAG TPA: CotS family spore coat protein [Clostridia bacterium]|nr:CotS family spore coat protein [Clostridia bacterium]